MGHTILPDIVEEHLEEADFLWHQRQAALADRVSTHHRLTEFEKRMLEQLDELCFAGAVAEVAWIKRTGLSQLRWW